MGKSIFIAFLPVVLYIVVVLYGSIKLWKLNFKFLSIIMIIVAAFFAYMLYPWFRLAWILPHM